MKKYGLDTLLLLFRCLMTGEIEGEKLACVRYMKCVPPFDEVSRR